MIQMTSGTPRTKNQKWNQQMITLSPEKKPKIKLGKETQTA
jgi:hypothetical protein